MANIRQVVHCLLESLLHEGAQNLRNPTRYWCMQTSCSRSSQMLLLRLRRLLAKASHVGRCLALAFRKLTPHASTSSSRSARCHQRLKRSPRGSLLRYAAAVHPVRQQNALSRRYGILLPRAGILVIILLYWVLYWVQMHMQQQEQHHHHVDVNAGKPSGGGRKSIFTSMSKEPCDK